MIISRIFLWSYMSTNLLFACLLIDWKENTVPHLFGTKTHWSPGDLFPNKELEFQVWQTKHETCWRFLKNQISCHLNLFSTQPWSKQQSVWQNSRGKKTILNPLFSIKTTFPSPHHQKLVSANPSVFPEDYFCVPAAFISYLFFRASRQCRFIHLDVTFTRIVLGILGWKIVTDF